MIPATFTRDPTKVSPHDEAARRDYLFAYFKAAGRFDEESLRRRYNGAVAKLSTILHFKGALRVGRLFFEYMVDQTVWDDSFLALKRIGRVAPKFPWDDMPKTNDYSQGISLSYKAWRLENGHRVPQDLPSAAPAISAALTGTAPLIIMTPKAGEPRVMDIAHIKVAFKEENVVTDKSRYDEVAEKKAKAGKEKDEEKANAASVMEKKVLAAKAIYDTEVTKIRAGRGKKGKEPMSDAPIMPEGTPLPIRPGFRVNKDKCVEQLQVASLAIRQNIWESINGSLSFKYPVIGPFEVELPPWLDFHGLIRGEDGELHKRLTSLHEFLTVDWLIAGGKPSCLVVGFKPSHEAAAKRDRHWHDLTTLWEDVVAWATQARYGSCTTLVDSLTTQHWKRMAVSCNKVQSRVAGVQSASERDLAAEEDTARERHNMEEALLPEVYAILKEQPRTSLAASLEAWVRRESSAPKHFRATLAGNLWVLSAAREQRADWVAEAIKWQHSIVLSLKNED